MMANAFHSKMHSEQSALPAMLQHAWDPEASWAQLSLSPRQFTLLKQQQGPCRMHFPRVHVACCCKRLARSEILQYAGMHFAGAWANLMAQPSHRTHRQERELESVVAANRAGGRNAMVMSEFHQASLLQ